ncbi:hypothetical protein NOCARDAX2BIS_220141 [Nocardioides sp. AX2bis]|nr:hypothetical protein NOCARDAX2BIS_220141 [Nocardioides sp. AX2bis]
MFEVGRQNCKLPLLRLLCIGQPAICITCTRVVSKTQAGDDQGGQRSDERYKYVDGHRTSRHFLAPAVNPRRVPGNYRRVVPRRARSTAPGRDISEASHTASAKPATDEADRFRGTNHLQDYPGAKVRLPDQKLWHVKRRDRGGKTHPLYAPIAAVSDAAGIRPAGPGRVRPSRATYPLRGKRPSMSPLLPATITGS